MPRVPSYRLHKPSGRAVLQYKPLFGARRIYLDGRYGSPESKAHYKRLLAQITAHMGAPEKPHPKPGRAVIGELVNAFLDHAETYYGKDSKEFGHHKIVGRFLYREHSTLPCAEFGPLKLESLREKMIASGWSRQHVNRQVGRLRRFFRWGVSRELVSESVYSALKTLDPLIKGKTAARESPPVRPVSREAVERVLPFVPPVIRAMIEVQYLTGMRSDELVEMRGRFISTEADVWIYEPTDHKNTWRGHRKIICLGPLTRGWLEPYRTADPDMCLFSPQIALEEQRTARKVNRKTKAYGKAASAKPVPRSCSDQYTAHAYQRAVIHGFRKLARSILLPQRPPDVSPREWSKRCTKPKGVKLADWLGELGISYWHPHQLRHARATMTRSLYGIEGAQAQTGNTLEAAEIYAERSLELALRIARETG